jgi:hypothetical protein
MVRDRKETMAERQRRELNELAAAEAKLAAVRPPAATRAEAAERAKMAETRHADTLAAHERQRAQASRAEADHVARLKAQNDR